MPEAPDEQNVLLSPPERRRLLEDIGRIGLMLGRQLLPVAMGESEIPLRPRSDAPFPGEAAPLERLALLRTLWPQTAAAVTGLMHRTDCRLVSAVALVPLARSRGLPGIGKTLAGTPQGAHLWRAATSRRADAARNAEQNVPEDSPKITTETPANRFAATLLLTIQEEAEALARLADFCGCGSDSAAAAAIADEAAALRCQPPLRGLRPLELSAAQRFLATGQLLRCPPPYRALQAAWNTLAASLHFDWSGSPLLRLPALEAWHLYEIWCFLQTAAAVQAAGWRLIAGDAVRWHVKGLRLELRTGQPSHLRFHHAGYPAPLELLYQPYFSSANQARPRRADENGLRGFAFSPFSWPNRKEALHSEGSASDVFPDEAAFSGVASRSHVMQPDMALGFRQRLFLLDAKYRDYAAPPRSLENTSPGRSSAQQEGALQEDIDKMHTYRDALHRGGENVAEAAWCLFPGAPDGPEIVAYPESRPEQPFGTAGVGAVRLRPGQAQTAFAGLLSWWLASAERRAAG